MFGLFNAKKSIGTNAQNVRLPYHWRRITVAVGRSKEREKREREKEIPYKWEKIAIFCVHFFIYSFVQISISKIALFGHFWQKIFAAAAVPIPHLALNYFLAFCAIFILYNKRLISRRRRRESPLIKMLCVFFASVNECPVAVEGWEQSAWPNQR